MQLEKIKSSGLPLLRCLFSILILTNTLSSCDQNEIDQNDLNRAPDVQDQIFEVLESAQDGTFIGNINAFDPDGDSLEYKLLNETEVFSLDRLNGDLYVKNTSLIVFEDEKKYELNVEVNDGLAYSAALVEISVLEDSSFTEVEINCTILKETSINGFDDTETTYTYNEEGRISTITSKPLASGNNTRGEIMEFTYRDGIPSRLLLTVKDFGIPIEQVQFDYSYEDNLLKEVEGINIQNGNPTFRTYFVLSYNESNQVVNVSYQAKIEDTRIELFYEEFEWQSERVVKSKRYVDSDFGEGNIEFNEFVQLLSDFKRNFRYAEVKFNAELQSTSLYTYGTVEKKVLQDMAEWLGFSSPWLYSSSYLVERKNYESSENSALIEILTSEYTFDENHFPISMLEKITDFQFNSEFTTNYNFTLDCE